MAIDDDTGRNMSSASKGHHDKGWKPGPLPTGMWNWGGGPSQSA